MCLYLNHLTKCHPSKTLMYKQYTQYLQYSIFPSLPYTAVHTVQYSTAQYSIFPSLPYTAVTMPVSHMVKMVQIWSKWQYRAKLTAVGNTFPFRTEFTLKLIVFDTLYEMKCCGENHILVLNEIVHGFPISRRSGT